MSRLTRDGTAEPNSRDQILRRELGQEKIRFLVQLTISRIGLTIISIRLMPGLLNEVMTQQQWYSSSGYIRQDYI